MKQLHVIILLGLLSLTSGLQAQEQANPGEQLLVFRNTGVVDLLYTNEVDSILTNDTTQVFYTKDTTLVVPFVELDSVAVGSRNEIEIRSDVREMTAEVDLPWIIRFDGNAIFYRLDTPATILPKVGERLFYGLDGSNPEAAVFPYGLTAQATAVSILSNEIRVDVEMLGLKDIFKKFFYAGSYIQQQPANVKQRRADRDNGELIYDNKIGLNIPIPQVGDIDIHGTVTVSGPIVMNPFADYYSADLDFGIKVNMDLQLRAEESNEYHYESFDGQYQEVASLYRVLNIGIALGAFVDLNAELYFDLGLERSWHQRVFWERRGNEQTWSFPEMANNERDKNHANVELVLDGNMYFGPIAGLEIATVGSLLGARAKLKFGPEIEGKVNFGMLRELRNYNQELYGQAKLDVCSKISLEGSIINRHYLLWGDVDEHKVAESYFAFGGWTWNLFPDYRQSIAVATTNMSQQVQADLATSIPEPTPTDTKTGFEIVDPQGEVVDSVFVGTIEAEPENATVAQTFDTEISLPSSIKQEDLGGYTMRPIFHYAGYTISAAPVGIRKDVLLQPYSVTQTNGAMTFIGNSPFLGSSVKDSTLYQVGLYLPVPLKNNVYQQGKDRKIITGTPIDDYSSGLLIGTWTGIVNGEDVTLTFNEDDTGKFNNVAFVYELNNPQSGDLELKFDNGETMIFRLLSVTEGELMLMDKRDESQTVWNLTNHQ